MELKCPNPKCKYKWEYNGKAPFYASCPRCHTNVKIDREKNTI